MSDSNDSGGIIGAIISALILVAIWPYLLALLGIYIAYMVVLAILAWIAENWMLVAGLVCGALGVYCLFRHQLFSKAWRYAFFKTQAKSIQVELNDPSQRNWIPSTNLYCYWCTKKLGLQILERAGKYYCQFCYENICKTKEDPFADCDSITKRERSN